MKDFVIEVYAIRTVVALVACVCIGFVMGWIAKSISSGETA